MSQLAGWHERVGGDRREDIPLAFSIGKGGGRSGNHFMRYCSLPGSTKTTEVPCAARRRRRLALIVGMLVEAPCRIRRDRSLLSTKQRLRTVKPFNPHVLVAQLTSCVTDSEKIPANPSRRRATVVFNTVSGKPCERVQLGNAYVVGLGAL